MEEGLRFGSLPSVLDDDEAPFVLGLQPDTRPHVEIGGARYRRGQETYMIEWPVGDELTLRAQGSQTDGACCVAAFVGPLFNDWWPMLGRGAASPARPVLSAGAAGRAVTMAFEDATLPVTVVRPSTSYSGTVMAAMLRGGFTEENLVLAHGISLGVIKAALLALVEYRTLVSAVPDVDADLGGAVLPLEVLLAVAAEASTVVDRWQVA